MGQIRKQAIYSSIVIYIGFLVGFVNTYLFVREDNFSPEQYGLTRIINDLGTTLFSFATLGVISYIYRFYPYYKANLKDRENDQLAVSLVLSAVGFLLVTVSVIIFQPIIVRKFSERSLLFVDYYYWTLPFALGVLVFTVFESFAWFRQKSIFTNFLRETGLRLYYFVITILFLFRWISFPLFVKLFSFSFLWMAVILMLYLHKRGGLTLHFKPSKVTRRFSRSMVPFVSLIYGSLIIGTLAQYIDSIVIASLSPKGLSDVGVYTLSSFITNTIQVPMRSIVAATIPVLAASWRTKNYDQIRRIYQRSSINLLILSLLIFGLIWLNIDDFFRLMKINKDYEAGKTVILILGIGKIIDAGTGVNSQLIGTSRLWRFDVITSIVLLLLMIPLNYFLVKEIGINGSAIANLISFAIYNALRLYFIYWKFRMQPFNIKTLLSLILATSAYFLCTSLFSDFHGWAGMFFRSGLFTALMLAAIFFAKLTPDAPQLLQLARERWGRFFGAKKTQGHK